MLLTHFVMGWTVLTVLNLCLPVMSAVEVIQPYKVVSVNGTAQVQCMINPQPLYHQTQSSVSQRSSYPYPDPEVIRVTLLKGLYGKVKFCSYILRFTEQERKEVKTEEEVQCSANLTEGVVEVTVSGLKPTDTDIYRCQVEVFYPPPYVENIGNGTLIHVVDDSECPMLEAQKTGEEDDKKEEESETLFTVPVVVLVILITFVLLIIIFFQIIPCDRRRTSFLRTVSSGPCKVEAVAFAGENYI